MGQKSILCLPQGTVPERATCKSYKLSDYKFSAEDEKYYMFRP